MFKTLAMVAVIICLGYLIILLIMEAIKYYHKISDEYYSELRKAERDAREAADDLEYELNRTTNASRRRRSRRSEQTEGKKQ